MASQLGFVEVRLDRPPSTKFDFPPTFEQSTEAPPPSPEPSECCRLPVDGEGMDLVDELGQVALFDAQKLCERVRLAFREEVIVDGIEKMDVEFPLSLTSSADSSPPVRLSPASHEGGDRTLSLELDFGMRRRSASLKRLREPGVESPEGGRHFPCCGPKRLRTHSDSGHVSWVSDFRTQC